jgi:hypothetical protein
MSAKVKKNKKLKETAKRARIKEKNGVKSIKYTVTQKKESTRCEKGLSG